MPWRIKTHDWKIPSETVYSTKTYKNYDDAMEYIENYIPEIENGTLSPDDIEISYHG